LVASPPVRAHSLLEAGDRQPRREVRDVARHLLQRRRLLRLTGALAEHLLDLGGLALVLLSCGPHGGGDRAECALEAPPVVRALL
jgi:hypothetical protein